MDEEDKTFLNISCLMTAAYTLNTYQHWWKEMFNERFGICGKPATRVICITLFMLSVLISL